ncbi:MAG: DUF3613 domain-containing protein [Achromobacter sp.]|uniref:DUF3613 domain-containing protein n=1 Tax=Achromobacter sp. TaxID=134375 RepID=UPI0012C7730D|nr:DUF3613 domain-containing protein [Achromobacter sp.]
MSKSRNSVSFVLTTALTTALAALAPIASLAQSNAPLTGSMSGAGSASAPASAPAQALPQAQLPARPVVQQVQSPMPQPAAAAPATASAPGTATPAPAQAAAPEEAFGDVTRGLLAAQADGRRAGNALPVLGPVSTAAWNRYLESFSHPIPEYFRKRVETKNTN